jgi:hypothetical protein
MRVSVAIEIANGYRPITYAGPLSPFIAQLAAAYLQAPAAWRLERRAHFKAIAGYQTSSPCFSGKLDCSV